MQLAIGTVQFGMNYGVANYRGQVALAEVESILTYAKMHNIDTLDTAQGYGESEKILGRFDLADFKIITKIIGDGVLETSLEKLKIPRVYGLMFHREDEINDETWQKFVNYKNQKMVEKIGVSVYSPEKLETIIARFPLDMVQIPLNLLDQRFLPLLKKLKAKNIEIHARSIFLQGLLLMRVGEVNPYFAPIKNVLSRIPEPKIAAAISFIKRLAEIDKIVVGVTTKNELAEICRQYETAENNMKFDFSQLAIDDEKFINPAKWKW